MFLTTEQIQILKDFGFDWNHTNVNEYKDEPRKLRRELRYMRKYGVVSSITWSADYEILKLLFLALVEEKRDILKTQKQLQDYFDTQGDAWSDLFELNETKQKWFAEKTQIILQLYKNMAPRFIDMHYHKFQVNLNGYTLKGDQMFFLNWLLERLNIFKQNQNPEEFEKFTTVWKEVAPSFWW